MGCAYFTFTRDVRRGDIRLSQACERSAKPIERGLMRLPKSLLMFSASGLAICVFTLASQDSVVGNTMLAVVLLLGIALGLLELVVGMTWGGPLKHAFLAHCISRFTAEQNAFPAFVLQD